MNIIFNLKSKLINEFYLVNSFKFIIITSISKLFSFLVFPILSRNFAISDFGYYDIFVIFITVASSVGLLGLDSMIYRFLHDNSIKITKTQLVSNTLFTQVLTIIFILAGLFFCFHFNIIKFNGIKLTSGNFIFLSLALIGMVLYSVAELILKISASLKNYTILVMLNSTIFLFFTYVSVKYFSIDMLNYLKLYGSIYFLLGCIGLVFIRPYISLKNFKIIDFEYLSYGLPLCLLTLVPLVQAFFIRTFILQFLDVPNIGIYAAASKLTILYSLPALAVSYATIPLLLRNSKSINFNIIANKFIFFTLILMSLCLFTFTMFGSELSILAFGPNYNSSGMILSFLCIGLFLQSVNGIISIGSLIKKGTSLRFFSSLLIAILSLSICYFFVKTYGLKGLLIGILTGNVLQLMLDLFIAQRLFKIQWDSLRIFIFITFTLMLSIYLQYVSNFLIVTKIFIFFILLILNIILYVYFVYKKKVIIPF